MEDIMMGVGIGFLNMLFFFGGCVCVVFSSLGGD
jgi:hypothetical protein